MFNLSFSRQSLNLNKYFQFKIKLLFSWLIGKKLLLQNINHAGATENITQQMSPFDIKVNPEN